MSWNAREAYERNELPKSKWTKERMLDAIEEINEDCLPLMRRLKKDTIFKRFFIKTAWHHTSKFYNETDFYAPAEYIICDLTTEDLQKLLDQQNAEKEQCKKEAAEKESEPIWCIACCTENVGYRRYPKWEEKSFAGYIKGGYFYDRLNTERHRIKNNSRFSIRSYNITEEEAIAYDKEQDEKRKYVEYLEQNAFTNRKDAKKSKEEFETIHLIEEEIPDGTKYESLLQKKFYLPVSKKYR